MRISQEVEASSYTGEIKVNGFEETFFMCKGKLTKATYLDQWKRCRDFILVNNAPGAFFTSLEVCPDQWGSLWYWAVIPGDECEADNDVANSLPDFYMYQSFKYVTLDVQNFRRKIFETHQHEKNGIELPLYFLDLQNPEKFFGYIQSSVGRISKWSLSRRDLAEMEFV